MHSDGGQKSGAGRRSCPLAGQLAMELCEDVSPGKWRLRAELASP